MLCVTGSRIVNMTKPLNQQYARQKRGEKREMAEWTGLEPAISWVTGSRIVNTTKQLN